MSELARQLIAENKKTRNPSLDLGNCGLTNLPAELADCTWLTTLVLSHQWDAFTPDQGGWMNRQSANQGPLNHLASLAGIEQLVHLQELVVAGEHGKFPLNDLAPLANLRQLRYLDLENTELSDLGPLANLPNLEYLSVKSTDVKDLRPLADLQQLQFLICTWAPLEDLRPLSNLTNLLGLACGLTQVNDLSPLAGLTNLESLSCGGFQSKLTDLSPLAGLTKLKALECSMTKVTDLSPLENLSELQMLSLWDSSTVDLGPIRGLLKLRFLYLNREVSDLSPLAGLQQLEKPDLGYSQVSDLSPIRDLVNLKKLDFSSTSIVDLSPIKGLTQLTHLRFRSTPVNDLSVLAGLTALQSLDIHETQVHDLTPLAQLFRLERLNLDQTPVTDLSPLLALTGMQALYCRGSQVRNLAGLAGMQQLHRLECHETPVSDLSPLANLTSLKHLQCDKTQVRDLGPLGQLPNLEWVDCSVSPVNDLGAWSPQSPLRNLYCHNTEVADLSPLANLSALEMLDCHDTQVADLSPLVSLESLKNLNCSCTQVSDLSPISQLVGLEGLDCSYLQVSDLSPVSQLVNLKGFNCSETLVDNLKPLAALTQLRMLNFGGTRVSDLAPVAHLQQINDLTLYKTGVNNLRPLSSLTALKTLNCSNNAVHDLSPLAELPLLKNLECRGCPIKTIPPEIAFSGDGATIRQYLLSDLDTPFNEAKLILAGNTRAGKTNLADFLVQGYRFRFSDEHDSSHGVLVGRWDVSKAQLPADTNLDGLGVNVWDFGGQDFYHGTHNVFFRHGAVYALVWEHEKPASGAAEEQCLPEDYWLEDIRHHAPASPLLSVQNKTDRDGLHRLPMPWQAYYGVQAGDQFHLSLKTAALEVNSEAHHDWQSFVQELARQLSVVPAREEIKINHRWLLIREYLRELQAGQPVSAANPFAGVSPERPYLTRDEFCACCAQVAPDFARFADAFLQVFEKRGLLIHFAEHPQLRDVVFLHPEWVTRRMYHLLAPDLLQQGYFSRDYASARLGADTDLLLQLMLEYAVIFADPRQPDTYVAVQYLPPLNPATDLDARATRLNRPWLCLRLPLFHQRRLLRQLTVRLGADPAYGAPLLRHDALLLDAPDGSLLRVEAQREGSAGVLRIFAEHPEEWGVQVLLELLLALLEQYPEFGITLLERYGWAALNQEEEVLPLGLQAEMRPFFATDAAFAAFWAALGHGQLWADRLSPIPKVYQGARIWGQRFAPNLRAAFGHWRGDTHLDDDLLSLGSSRAARFAHLTGACHLSTDAGAHWTPLSDLFRPSATPPDAALAAVLRALGF